MSLIETRPDAATSTENYYSSWSPIDDATGATTIQRQLASLLSRPRDPNHGGSNGREIHGNDSHRGASAIERHSVTTAPPFLPSTTTSSSAEELGEEGELPINSYLSSPTSSAATSGWLFTPTEASTATYSPSSSYSWSPSPPPPGDESTAVTSFLSSMATSETSAFVPWTTTNPSANASFPNYGPEAAATNESDYLMGMTTESILNSTAMSMDDGSGAGDGDWFQLAAMCFKAFIFGTIIIGAVLGNALVIISVRRNRKLR